MTDTPRRGPARRLPYADVLDRWAAGASVARIAAALGVQPSSVRLVVHKSRQEGDPRAARRRAPNGQRGRGWRTPQGWQAHPDLFADLAQ